MPQTRTSPPEAPARTFVSALSLWSFLPNLIFSFVLSGFPSEDLWVSASSAVPASSETAAAGFSSDPPFFLFARRASMNASTRVRICPSHCFVRSVSIFRIGTPLCLWMRAYYACVFITVAVAEFYGVINDAVHIFLKNRKPGKPSGSIRHPKAGNLHQKRTRIFKKERCDRRKLVSEFRRAEAKASAGGTCTDRIAAFRPPGKEVVFSAAFFSTAHLRGPARCRKDQMKFQRRSLPGWKRACPACGRR